MTAPESIKQLVARFEEQLADYKSGRYNETQVRNDFLDPLFEALGWDVNNHKNYSEKFREVIKEASVEVDGTAKAADYAFQSGGNAHFLLEAKKPSVNIETSTEAAFQIRRYAWSKKLAVSVLSDFEQLAIYDCRQKPSHSDAAHVGRTNLFSYKEYVEKWDEISDLLSYEAVHRGSLEKYAESSKGKRGTADVDDAFLAEMEEWREHLARNIALRNPGLGTRAINSAVQLIIDRIIFLRICEDRGIEPENGLRDATDGIDVYGDLMELFRKADQRYNSGLFHFEHEKGQSSHPDKLTPTLKIDDKVFKDILANLYPPKSPYAFKYFSAEILGQVYERFLGKVIRLTEGGHAKVEEKPEVRKAGGVYYTPTYIVDYIVKNTLGELLKDKTPAEMLLEPVRVLDPACGSGSFLLGAYQYLLDWYLDWYTQHDPARWAKGKNPPLFETGDGYQLTMEKKKEILTGHIFGVDIDAQAVEVTKLSLLLKVVENPGQLTLLGERLLPDLGENIKCGNSLIGPDYYDGQQMALFDEEERYRVNAFDWQAEYPQAFAKGGFDCVIGNPPYIPIESITEADKNYLMTKFKELERKFDTSIIFILQGLKKLNSRGLLGFISSITWQTGENYKKLRKTLFIEKGVRTIINLPFDVFKDAFVDTGIYILSSKPTSSYSIFQFSKKARNINLTNINYAQVSKDLIIEPDYKIILNPIANELLRRIKNNDICLLGDFTVSTQGLAGNKFKTSEIKKEKNFMPFLENGQVHRYQLIINKICFTDMSDKKSIISYYLEKPKILIRRVISRQDRLLATIHTKELVTKKDINPFIITDQEWDIYYVLGIINSQLISYLYINTSTIALKDDFRQTTLAELRNLPFIRFNSNDKNQKLIIINVKNMLSLYKQASEVKLPSEQERVQREIEMTDRQIDKLVYELYGLSEEEIRIVEGG